MTSQQNFWASTWGHPRKSVKDLLQMQPKYGLRRLSVIFALESFFFCANWWSWGLFMEWGTIFFVSLVCSPVIGLSWLYLSGWVYSLTGRLLGGGAPALHLRAAIAWSKIPAVLSLLLWFGFLLFRREVLFVQDGGGPSSVWVSGVATTLFIWSSILLIQSLREVQSFSWLRAFTNVSIASLMLSGIYLSLFVLGRLVYILS